MAPDGKPKAKRAARPRIDAIIRHIKSGSYDAEIGEIKAAIEERNNTRKMAVMETVKEVFGSEARVVTAGAQIPAVSATKKVELIETAPARRARPGSVTVTSPAQEGDNGQGAEEDPELIAAQERALTQERELEAELASSGGSGSGQPEDDEAGVVSNSPIIGSVER